MIEKLKYTMLTLLISVMNCATSGTMGTDMTPYDAFYVGGDIGVSNLMDPTSTTDPLAAHHMSATGIIGGGLVGYDYSMTEQLTLGVEGFGNANGIHMSSLQLYPPQASYRVGAKYNAGLRVLPGYKFNSGAVAHVLLGYTNAGFTITDNGDYGYIDQHFNKNGFQCGLGMKVPITNNLSIRADALYSIYANASNIGLSNLAPYGPQTYYNNLSTLEGDLTILYKFNS